MENSAASVSTNSETSNMALETPPSDTKTVLTPQVINVEAEQPKIENEAQPSELDLLMAKIKPASCGKKRTYSTIDISADKWFLTLDSKALLKLNEPPSLADGLDSEKERQLRLLGCELIQSGAILLRLPQTASATGQILFQRYYYQKSFVRYNMLHTVMACLLLASRIEEAPRRPRDVINVVNRLKQLHNRRHSSKPRSGIVSLKIDKNYVELKNIVIKTERRLLNVLGFVVHVQHPHKLIYAYMHVLKLLDRKDILYKAWNYMNDGLRTDIFLRYRAETIACACIFLAARTVNDPVPLPDEPRPWFELYDSEEKDVRSIALMLTKLYTMPKVPDFTTLNAHVEKLFKAKYEITKPEPPKVVEPKSSPDRKRKDGRSSSRSRDRSKRSSRDRSSRDHRRSSRDRSPRRRRDHSPDRKHRRRRSRSRTRSPPRRR